MAQYLFLEIAFLHTHSFTHCFLINNLTGYRRCCGQFEYSGHKVRIVVSQRHALAAMTATHIQDA